MSWMNDAVPNHNGNNGFPHMNDPNAAAMMDPSAFMANSAQFNPAAAQYAGQQMQQQMPGAIPNGQMRNASPSFQNPVYQTNSVIPSKRPRPREDSLAGSPRQNPGGLPTSRSETPQQQNFPAGFQPGGAQPQQQTPSGQFPHLQANGSANASPSPIMANQMRPNNVPQRVATASPHPYSPTTQQPFASQTSPVQSEHGTPQPNQFMPPGYNQNYAPSPSNPRPSPNPNSMSGQMMAQQMGQMPQQMAQMPNNMYQMQQAQQQGQQQQPPQPNQQGHQQPQQQPRQQNMTDQQKMAAYQMRLQQQLQGNMQMQAQMQAQNMGRGMMTKQQQQAQQQAQQQMAGMPNGQVPQGAMRPQQRGVPGANPEQFMKNLSTLMNAKGLPLDPNPMIADRPVHLMLLFQAVQSKGGCKNVTANNGWAVIAQSIGLPAQMPNVPPALRSVYERNLYKFEEVWTAQQKQRMMQQQNAGMANQGTPQRQMQQHQQQPTPQMNQGQMMPQAQHQTPSKPAPPPVNGLSTPQPQSSQQANPMSDPRRNSMSSGVDQQGVSEFATPGTMQGKPGAMATPQAPQIAGPQIEHHRIFAPPEKTDEYNPCARELIYYGGLDIAAINMLGTEIERWKIDGPSFAEMGLIDIAALTRSLQSGIHGEVRLALDSLATVTSQLPPNQPLALRFSEDLVDALVQCGEDQLEILAEHTPADSDEIQLVSYENVVRACRLERWTVREVKAFGTEEYEVERAIDRLICLTTILRNLSFPSEQCDNHVVLADEDVLKFLTTAIRYLGTRTTLLRTSVNTLDFMKDAIIILSNVAGSIELPSREQALALLQFILAFAPMPGPSKVEGTTFFPNYEPQIHSYLPHAVDSLAKLLARDEPNRTHYKAIFAADATSSSPHELLSRTFALAVCPIPNKSQDLQRLPHFPPLVEMRKPFLMQGLLSAEIVASLAPSAEASVVRSWVASDNGLMQDILRMVRELSHQFDSPQHYSRGSTRTTGRKDPELVYIVVVAVSLLKKLAEKARDPNDHSLPAGFLPPAQALLEATSMSSPEWTKEGFLQQLTAFFNS